MLVLVYRAGSIGDQVLVTPLLRYLKNRGDTVYFAGNNVGLTLLKGNPNVDKLISCHMPKFVEVDEYNKKLEELQDKYKPDLFINCNGVVEHGASIMQDSVDFYKSTELRQFKYANINFIENHFTEAGIDTSKLTSKDFIPEMYYDKKEKKHIKGILDSKKFNLVYVMGGSGRYKRYPHVDNLIFTILDKYPDIEVYLIGGKNEVMLEEGLDHERIHKMCGNLSIRESMLLSSKASCIISPDTGMLHAAGCNNTPKISILTNTSVNNVTKHYKNVHNITATAKCSPCCRIIYPDIVESTCNCDEDTAAPECIYNIKIESIIEALDKVMEGD